MAAVAAHLTRVARVSTNTRVKYAQQYMNKPDQPSGDGSNSHHATDSSLCTTMSRLQFDGYEWDMMDEHDNEGLTRRLTRKLTTLQDIAAAEEADVRQRTAPAPPSPPRTTKPTILARFDTEAKMLMAPSRPRLIKSRSDEAKDTTERLTPVKPIMIRMATNSKSEPASPKQETAAAAAAEPIAPVTPILTTRRFREGRSSFMNRSASELRLASGM